MMHQCVSCKWNRTKERADDDKPKCGTENRREKETKGKERADKVYYNDLGSSYHNIRFEERFFQLFNAN